MPAARRTAPKRASPMVRQPDQNIMPFMEPPTSWVRPAELPDWRGRPELAFDLECKDDGLKMGRAPSWVYSQGHIAGLGASDGAESLYFPIRHPETDNFDPDAVRRWFEDHMRAPGRKVFQNPGYDLGWVGEEWGYRPSDDTLIDDTIAASYMLDEWLMERNLDYLCKWRGLPGKDEAVLRAYAQTRGMDPKADLWRMPARFVGAYGGTDPLRTIQLMRDMRPELEKQDLVGAYQTEVELVPMILEMRRRGVRIDTGEAPRVQARILARRDEALREITRQLGHRRDVTIHDISSPLWMERVFTEQGITFPRTDKDNPSFKSEWMAEHEHWLPSLCALASQLHDAGDKFIGQYILQFCHHGRIHAEIHQYKTERGGTRTNRLSYSDPPLQQIIGDKHPELAAMIRSLFLPEEGELWAAPDFSQQELRLMVHFGIACRMAGVEQVAQRYRDDPNTDFHEMTSAITGLNRRKAKDVTFAKAFGAGVPKFASMTGQTLEEAQAAMDQYDRELPFVKRLAEFCQARAQHRGHIRLIDGARSRYEKWEPRWVDWRKMRQWMDDHNWPDMPTKACSRAEALERQADPRHYWSQCGSRLQRSMTHKAMNSLIQGSGARQCKRAMRDCWRAGIVPVLQMHDELSASVSSPETGERMREIMVEAVRLEVPVRVDLEYGAAWGTAKVRKDAEKRVVYGATWDEAWAEARAARPEEYA